MPDNLLLWGDNLDMLRHHVRGESVDLIYLDPPFKSNQNYNVLFREQDGPRAAAQIRAFEDTWQWDSAAVAEYRRVVEGGDRVAEVLQALRMIVGGSDMLAYLTRMAPRLVELRRVLKPTGSIYLHCDPTASHYLKLLMDAVFSPRAFRNEISWRRTTTKGDYKQGAENFPRVRDVILYYRRDGVTKGVFHQPFAAYDATYVRKKYPYQDPDGRRYGLWDLTAPGSGSRGHPRYEFLGVIRYWRYNLEKMNQLLAAGRVVQPRPGAVPRYKRYLDEMPGVALGDSWDDIPPINSQARERLGYQTQKPEALLERIIQASSNEGDTVLDPFCGCGTAISVAHRLRRRWVGIDITILAIGLITQRLEDAFGREAAQAYRIIGEPTVFEEAVALAEHDRHQFQSWAIYKAGGLPVPVEARGGADRGIDGRLFFHDENGNGPSKQVLFSVKSGTNIGVRDVRDLRAVVEREGAASGVLITLHDPTQPMKVEAGEAGEYVSPWGGQRFPRLQIITAEELFAGDRVLMPPRRETVTLKRAPRAKGKPSPQGKLFGQQGAG